MNAHTRKVIGLATASLIFVGFVGACDNSGEQSPPERATATGTTTPAPAQKAGASNTSANEGRYEVRSAQEPVEVGKKAKVELAITPGDDLKINPEFPWKLEFSDNADVKIAQKTISDSQIEFDDSEATFPVMLEATAAGAHELKATGNFSVCRDTKCFSIRDEPLSFKLEAKAAEGSEKTAEPKEAAEPTQQ